MKVKAARKLALWLGLLFLGSGLLLGACGSDDRPSPEPEPNPGCCEPGLPAQSMLYPGGCADDRDCAPGTVCEANAQGGAPPDELPSEAACSAKRSDPKGQCRVPALGAPAAALLAGFEVRRFELHRSETNGNAYEFEAPRGTSYVTCALFGCTPVIEGRQLAPAHTCTLIRTTFQAPSGSFDLSDPLLQPRKPTLPCDKACENVCRSDASWAVPDYYTDFSVGCWAYGDVDLIGATPLVPVDPAQSASQRFGMRADCAPEKRFDQNGQLQTTKVDGANCPLPLVNQIGTCYDGICRQRCVFADTCQSPLVLGTDEPACAAAARASGEVGAGGASGAVHFVCQRPYVPNSLVGLCQQDCEGT